MRIGNTEFLATDRMMQRLGCTRTRLSNFRKHPQFEYGIHAIATSKSALFWNPELIDNLLLNFSNREAHQEAIDSFRANTKYLQKGVPSVRKDEPHAV
jgi:hypothetical protein